LFFSRIIFSENGYTTEECLYFKPFIFSNTIQSMLAILQAMNRLKISFGNPIRQVDIFIVGSVEKKRIFFLERCRTCSCLY
jgi:hypothetical protein